MIDGGLDYIRTSVNKEPAESLALYDDEPFEKIREVVCRWYRDWETTSNNIEIGRAHV